MAEFYYIVPKNNGYVYLGQKPNGECFLIPKGHENKDYELLFRTGAEAAEYIKTYLDDSYMPEIFWYNEEYVCPRCGGPLYVEEYIEANKSNSGYDEYLCICRFCKDNRKIMKDKGVVVNTL